MADAVPGGQLGADVVSDDGRHELRDGGRDDLPTGLQVPAARVVERGDDVLLERVVAERLGHHQVDARGIVHLGRQEGHEVTVARLVALQDLGGDAGNLGAFIEVDLAGAEPGGDQPEHARARADVGDGRLARHDELAQGGLEGLDADVVGDQGAVIFDAHGSKPEMAAAELVERQRRCHREIEGIELAGHRDDLTRR